MIEFKLLWYYQSKELGLLGEVIGFRSGAGKIQDKPETSCGVRKQRSIWQRLGYMTKGRGRQPEGAASGDGTIGAIKWTVILSEITHKMQYP